MNQEFYTGRIRAFTLIELLTSLAILGILASLLIPAIQASRQKVLQIECMNNQRQLMHAWTMHANDHNGRLASNGYARAGGLPGLPLWVQGYLNADAAINDAGDPKMLLNSQYAEFARYLQTSAVYRCPVDPGHNGHGTDPHRLRSYAMNAWVGWSQKVIRPVDTRHRIYRSMEQIQSPGPSSIAVFLDVHPSSLCAPFFGIDMSQGPEAKMHSYPSSGHDQGGVIAFADGHVGRKEWQDPRTYRPGNVLYHSHDVPSPANPDLDWLQSHATRPESGMLTSR